MVVSKAEMRKQILAATGEKPLVAWLSPHEAAIYCNVGLSTFIRHIQDKVVTKKLGRRLLISVTSLENYMQGLDSGKPVPRQKKTAARG